MVNFFSEWSLNSYLHVEVDEPLSFLLNTLRSLFYHLLVVSCQFLYVKNNLCTNLLLMWRTLSE